MVTKGPFGSEFVSIGGDWITPTRPESNDWAIGPPIAAKMVQSFGGGGRQWNMIDRLAKRSTKSDRFGHGAVGITPSYMPGFPNPPPATPASGLDLSEVDRQ